MGTSQGPRPPSATLSTPTWTPARNAWRSSTLIASDTARPSQSDTVPRVAGKQQVGITKQERLYRAIRERILSGAYGPGYRVVIDGLAEEFEVSALPVREAIRRLEAEGLVVYRPNAGAHVAPAEPGVFLEELTVLA